MSIRPATALLIILFTLSTSTTVSLAGKPIPAGPDAKLLKDFRQAQNNQARRHYLDGYEKYGRKDPRWDDLAVKFLEIEVISLPWANNPAPLDDRLAAGKAVIDAGCEDPLVLHKYGQLLARRKHNAQAGPIFMQALEGFKSSGYDKSFLAWCTRRIMKVSDTSRRDTWKTRMRGHIPVMITEGDYLPEERRLHWRDLKFLLDECKLKDWQPILDAVKDDERTDPWLLNMMAGEMHVKLAWKARGGGWAYTVTEEGWKGFHEHLKIARKHLTRAYELDPTAPEAATKMITVAMAGGSLPGEDERFWFDRAVAAQLDHPKAYNQLIWAMRPRWGGSYPQMFEFGLECLRTERFDTEVPYQFFEVLRAIGKDHKDFHAPFTLPGAYEGMLKMADGYLARPCNDEHRRWLISLKAACAWRAHKWTEARKWLEEVNYNPTPKAFKLLDGSDPAETVGQIILRTEPAIAHVRSACEFLNTGQQSEAFAAFDRAIEELGEHPLAQRYVKGLIQPMKWDSEFKTGQWVDMTPPADLAGWKLLKGKWRAHEDGGVIGTAGNRGLMLQYPKPLGSRLEIELDMEFIRRAYNTDNAGVFLGDIKSKEYHSVLAYLQRNIVVVAEKYQRYKNNKPFPGFNATMRSRSTMRIQQWDDVVHVWINDELVCANETLENWAPSSDHRLTLGGHFWYGSPEILFHTVRVRKLTEQPETPEIPAQWAGQKNRSDESF